jgi:hypothetical protein
VPGAGACFVRDYDAAHLALNPQQGVAGLSMWFFDQVAGDSGTRAVALALRLADQGPARAAGLGGRQLRQILSCTSDGPDAGNCYVECDGGWFSVAGRDDGGIEIATDFVAIGEADACGGAVFDMAERGQRTVYRLAAGPAAACADLATPRPLPAPGCYGAQAPGGAVSGVRLLIDPPMDEAAAQAFPWAGGRMEMAIAQSPGAGALSGTAPVLWLGCSAFDGLCRHSDGTGSLTLAAAGGGLRLGSSGLTVYSAADDAEIDLTGALAALPVLAPQPMSACAGLEAE